MDEKRRRFGCGAGPVGTWSSRTTLAAWLLLGLGSWLGPATAGLASDPNGRDGAAVATSRPSAVRSQPARTVIPSDDWTFRPTVLVRRGPAQGSGTIIASVEGEALVLTAAHVVEDEGPIVVELHRYNLGLERTAAAGTWPRSMRASLAATDPAADLAVLRVDGLTNLPYVARLAAPRREVVVDSIVTSIGIDRGTHLSSWSSPLVEALWFQLNDNRDERLFLITARVPVHGRSGGGLFLPDGELVGVCIGHAGLFRGGRQGVFASRESIRRLLADSDLSAVVARSELRRTRLGQRPASSGATPTRSGSAPVTLTRAMGPDR